MRHPTEGTLRRLLDEPAGVPDADRGHVAGCPVCLSALSAAREDAALAATALGAPATSGAATRSGVDLDAAWRRLSASVAAGDRRGADASVPARRRAVLRRPVLAGIGVAAVLTGASAAAAADWLQIFRSERVAPIDASRTDLVALPEPEDLAGYGEFEVVSGVDVREVPDAAAAGKASGLPVPQVGELPRGVTGDPSYRVVDEVSAEFTFSAAEAAATVAAAGGTPSTPPAGLDGSTFRLVAGPGQAAVWEARGLPAMVVARAVAPAAYSSSTVPFGTAAEYLTGLPGVPAELGAQLAAFAGDGTLPLPLPTDEVNTTIEDVGGVPATVVTSRDGTMAGVVWVDDGVVTAVAGSLSADEVLGVARGLRDR